MFQPAYKKYKTINHYIIHFSLLITARKMINLINTILVIINIRRTLYHYSFWTRDKHESINAKTSPYGLHYASGTGGFGWVPFAGDVNCYFACEAVMNDGNINCCRRLPRLVSRRRAAREPERSARYDTASPAPFGPTSTLLPCRPSLSIHTTNPCLVRT